LYNLKELKIIAFFICQTVLKENGMGWTEEVFGQTGEWKKS